MSHLARKLHSLSILLDSMTKGLATNMTQNAQMGTESGQILFVELVRLFVELPKFLSPLPVVQ